MPAPPASMMLGSGHWPPCNALAVMPPGILQLLTGLSATCGKTLGKGGRPVQWNGIHRMDALIAKLKCRCTLCAQNMSQMHASQRRFVCGPYHRTTGSLLCHVHGMLSLANRSHDMTRLLLATTMIGFCLSLAACGGSRAIAQNNETCGKQLTDLQTALSSGAMSQSEYDRARSEAIYRCDHD
jgi:hypothetical protein